MGPAQQGHGRPRRRVLLEVEEEATRLGWAFFRPVIGEVVTAAEGFEDGELETVHRFLASVLEATRRARPV
ncbi:hypothetical protein [Streptomyces sp. NPDC014676]|uniref:hypothetical protein n=1 Tax=Streptomyces sp. NPDC014676 TaxID=3364879 RepID=UPI0036F5A1DD